jgi:hypothetical protein
MTDSRKSKRFVYQMNGEQAPANTVKLLNESISVSANVVSRSQENASSKFFIEVSSRYPNGRESFKIEVPEILMRQSEHSVECLERMNKNFMQNAKNAIDVVQEYYCIKTNLSGKEARKGARGSSLSAMARNLIRIVTAAYELHNQYNFKLMESAEQLEEYVKAMPTISTGALLAEIATIIKKNQTLYPYPPDLVEKDLAEFNDLIASNFEHLNRFLIDKRNRNHAIMTTENADDRWKRDTIHMMAAKESLQHVVATFYEQWFSLMKLMNSPERKDAPFVEKREAEAAQQILINAIESASEKYAEFKREAGYLPEGQQKIGNDQHFIVSKDTLDNVEDILEQMTEMANHVFAKPLKFREKTLGNVQTKSSRGKGGGSGRGA